MTTWNDVRNAIDFWDSDDSWGTGLIAFSQDEQDFITDSLRHFYDNSPIARHWLDLFAAPDHIGLRIGQGSPLEAIDFNYVRYNQYFSMVMINSVGEVVVSRPEYQLLHEVLHIAMHRGDFQSRDVFVQNQPHYDFWGPIVGEERKIAAEMGQFDQIPSAYLTRISTADAANFLGWTVGENYTNGQTITLSRIGDEEDNFLTMEPHEQLGDPTDDLIIADLGNDEAHGAGGADHLYGDLASTDGIGGNDRLYGEDGDDRLYGGMGDDLLSGGAGNDIISSAAGSDILWGGDIDNDQGAADGVDTANYASPNDRVTITFNGSGEVPTLTVGDGQGGTDTLHSIERIIGTAQVDYLYYSGSIPEDYNLTIDFAGGNDDITNGGASVTGLRIVIGPDNNGTLSDYDGTPSGPGGHINLLNVHSQIIGSSHDDWIVDSSSGTKRIDGGDGDDVVTIGGDGYGMIRGGGGHDILTGGDGSDVLIGGDGDNQLFGGAGTDMLIGDSTYDVQDGDLLDGGAGSDLLIARGEGSAILRGGGGNDLIDAREGGGNIEIGAGDGRDRIEGPSYAGPPPMLDGEFDPSSLLGIGEIRFTGFDLADATIYWNVTITDQEYNPGGLRWEYVGVGDLAIVVGDVSIFIESVIGTFSTFVNHNVFVDSTYFNIFEIPSLLFDDGALTNDDGRLNIDVVRASVAQYDLAYEDYAQGVEESVVDDEGTPGDDDLSGGIGDDALSGGDGDDSFRASGGADLFDGGGGGDILYLFGALLDFLITRDAATGDVTLEDQAGTEGRVTVKSVEKIYFAADNEEHDLGDLVGFWGTPGDDALVEGNARDNFVYGLAGMDLLRGLAGADVLFGGSGDDVLEGGAGDDWLYGEGGADTFNGGTGDDVHVVDTVGDVVVELAFEGDDLVYTSISYALGADAEVETLSTSFHAGTAAIDLTGNYFDQTIIGNYGVNTITGGVGADVMIGLNGDDAYIVNGAGSSVIEDAGGGNDTVYTSVTFALGANSDVEVLSTLTHAGTSAIDLTGSNTGQTIVGNYGANLLDGKGGNDLLAGLSGADTFAFTSALGASNVDTLFDFSVADDMIALDDAIFTAIGATLDAGEFVIGTAAADANDRVIYNSATGQLFYDADGNGGGSAIQFAALATGLALTAGDFTMI